MSSSPEPRLTVGVAVDDAPVVPLVDVAVPHDDVPARAERGDAEGFSIVLRHGPSRDDTGRDLVVEVTRTGAVAARAAIRLGAMLGPSEDPWLMIPGALYGENRPEGSALPYPAWRLRPDRADSFSSDRWIIRADRAATPVAIASDGVMTVGLATHETGDLGLAGLEVAADGERTEVATWHPYREAPARYDGSATPRPAVTTLHDWAPGEARTIVARLFTGPPDRHAFAPMLRSLHAWLAGAAAPVASASAEEALALAAEGLLRWHWRPADGVILETAAFERGPGDPGAGEAAGDRLAMHVAWVSGAPVAAALLAHGRRTGNADAITAGESVLDGICAHLAPAGTFWGQWTATAGWTKGWTPGEDRLHARTLAEATLFVTRAAAAEAGLGHPRVAWKDAVASNLEFVASVADADGALGSAYHGRTGVVESRTGSAGLAWVPALVEGAALLGRPAWRELARRAGAHYAAFVDRAFLHGAPEDVDLAPTSEDGYVAVMAYVALSETAADDDERTRWLVLATRAADWALSFRYTYDVSFPEHSLLRQYGYRSRGMDQASVANQHLHAYGLICVPELVRLGRATGDAWVIERAREHLVATRQLLAREDGEANARRGMLPERFYQTDCFGPKGGIGMLSHAWCLGLLLGAGEEARAIPELAEQRPHDPRAGHG